MAKFIYKFESIRKVKGTLEKQAQKEVALIDKEIENKKNEHKKIINEENESRNKFKKKAFSIGELKFIKGYELCLKNKGSKILYDIEELNLKRDLKMKELIKKTKEHKIFNKLEEKYSEDFQRLENGLELDFIDELATQKFSRREK